MPAPEEKKTTVVETVFKAVGLENLTKQFDKFGDALLDPVMVLAAGGTKAQAAWAGFRAVFLTKVMGPLGMVAGATTGFLLATKQLVKEWRTLGLAGAKAIETLTLQFKPLLGSMDLAKKRAREVFAFSVKSPFKFGELAEGNKILQGLTRGALSGKDGMELVGDAAAVAGEDFASMARQVGRLYDGLMSGRPVGEAAFRLQELGIISGQTRTQIEAMQDANAAGSAVWEVARQDILRNKGAMEALAGSLEGLESTYEDTRTQLQAGFGKGFMEGEKAGVKSATQLMDRLTPSAEWLGEMLGTVSNKWAAFKAWVMDGITSIPGFTTVVSGAAVALVGLAGAISAAAGGMLARFVAGILSASAAQSQLVAATGSATAAEAAQTAVSGSLAAAKAALLAVMNAVKAGHYANAAAALREAAVETVVAVRTNAVAAAQVVLRGALMLTVGALRAVLVSLRAVGVAMLTTPIGLLATILTVAGTAALAFYNKARKAREELDAMAASARAVVANLDAQIQSIRTLVDLRKAEADVVWSLSEAYVELAKAQNEGNDEKARIAEQKIQRLQALQVKARSMEGRTELSQEEVDRADALKQRIKDAKTASEDDDAARGAASTLEVARRRKAEADALREVEERAIEEEKRVLEKRNAMRRDLEDVGARELGLNAEKAALKDRIEEQRRIADAPAMAGESSMADADRKAARRAMEDYRKQLDQVEQALEGIGKAKEESRRADAEVALQSASELAVLQEKLAIHEELGKAIGNEREAQKKLDEARASKEGDESKRLLAIQEAERNLEKAAAEKSRASSLAMGAGVDGWQQDPLQRQNAERRIREIKAERDKNIDPVKKAELERQVRDAELALAQGRLETEQNIMGLRLRGYEREAMMLRYEERKLELARERGRIDEDTYVRQKTMLAEQKAALDKAAGEKRVELEAALAQGRAAREEEQARRAGDVKGAEAAKKRAEALADEQARRDAKREAEDLGGTEAERQDYIRRRVEEARAQREEARKRDEEDQRLARRKAALESGNAVDAVRSRVAEMSGRGAEARRMREEAARRQDALDREEKRRQYREQGFSGEAADSMARRDIKAQQAQRLLDELAGRRGSVIASSLAQVGGGGNVGGTDPTVRLQEKMVKILQAIEDNTKEDMPMR